MKRSSRRRLLAVLLFALPAFARALPGEDCNRNGTDDEVDLAAGTSRDCDLDRIPDECARPPEASLFGEPIRIPLPDPELLADLDGDQLPELLSIRSVYDPDGIWLYERDSIVVVARRGDGTFAAAGTYPLGRAGDELLAGDLNGDGNLDVLAGLDEFPYGRSPGYVRPFFGAGDGTLVPADEQPVGGIPLQSALLADLDGDDDLDLLFADYGTYWRTQEDIVGRHVVVLLNDGSGRFGAPRSFPAGDSPARLAAADFDGDGDLDIAATNTGDARDSPTVDTLSVLANRGDATFEAPVAYALGYPASVVEPLDLDGDGDLDLLLASWYSTLFSVLTNRGAGAFDPPRHYETSAGGPHKALARDLDDDSDLDLVFVRSDIRTRPNVVAVHLNVGGGSFGPPRSFSYEGDALLARRNTRDIDLGDVDGDGDLDLAVALDGTNTVAVHFNPGDGAFEEHVLFPVAFPIGTAGEYPLRVRLRDLDGDGDLDVVAGPAALMNGGAGGSDRGCRAFVRGDFNQDGALSVSDGVALGRWVFALLGGIPACLDAGDVDDDEYLSIVDQVTLLNALFVVPGWGTTIAPPHPAAGSDPTYAGRYPERGPLGCEAYEVRPAAATEDRVGLGDVAAAPGEEVEIPVYVAASVPVEAVQLVVRYDPGRLRIEPGGSDPGPLSFEGTFFGADLPESGPGFRFLNTHPDSGIFTVVIANDLVARRDPIPPGGEVLIAKIRATVSQAAPPGAEILLSPTNGEEAAGTGPFALRNEITHEGSGRLVSFLPQLVAGRLAIVGDQSFFRGDANGDSKVNLTDAVQTLNVLFLNGGPAGCEDAHDANDSGGIDLTDAVFTLNFLFLGGASLPPPYPEAGPDPTADSLHCRRFPAGNP